MFNNSHTSHVQGQNNMLNKSSLLNDTQNQLN